MSKILNGGLDQYGAEPFEQPPFGTAGVGWVNLMHDSISILRFTDKNVGHKDVHKPIHI